MYNKKKQKAKFKLRVELIAIILVVAVMIGLSFGLRLPNASTKLSNAYSEAGGSLDSSHIYVEKNYDKLVSHIESAEGLVYVFFGSPEDASCVTEISTVNSRASYWDVEEVIYFDASFALVEHEEGSDETLELEAEIKAMEEKLGVSLDFKPGLFVFENSEVVFDSNDFLNDDEDAPAMTLTWSQISDRAFCINLPEFDAE